MYQNELCPLHSTMFLLIHQGNVHDRRKPVSFTFHNVSINTDFWHVLIQLTICPLHSTMFLLIQHIVKRSFSYISPLHSTMFLLILPCCNCVNASFAPLHSTMFLLILGVDPPACKRSPFTFHNVSINTHSPLPAALSIHFTFHNVSINTFWYML